MVYRILTFICRLSSIILATSFLFAILGFVWLSAKPRVIPELTEHIERSISKALPSGYAKVGDATLLFSLTRNGLVLRVKDVTLFHDKGVPVAAFKESMIMLSIPSLIFGDVVLNTLQLDNAALALEIPPMIGGADARSTDEVLREHIYLEKKVHEGIKALFAQVKSDRFPVRQLRLNNIDLHVYNGVQDYAWKLEKAELNFGEASDNRITLELDAAVPKKKLGITLEFEQHSYGIAIMGNIHNLRVPGLHQLFPQEEWLAVMPPLGLRGEIKGLISNEGELKSLLAAMRSTRDSNLAMNVDLLYNAPNPDEMPSYQATVRIVEIAMGDVHYYWPAALAPVPRPWVAERISGGAYDNLVLKAEISPRTYSNETLSNDAVTVTSNFSGATIHYSDSLPNVVNVRGTADIGIEEGLIVIESGELDGGLNMLSGSVRFYGKQAGEITHAEVSAKVSGPVRSLLPYASKYYEGQDLSYLVDDHQIAGSAVIDARLDFPLIDQLSFDDVVFSAVGKATDVQLLDIANGASIAEGSFDITIDSERNEFKGTAYLGETMSTLSYVTYVDPDRDYRKEYRVTTVMTDIEMQRYIADLPEGLRGNMGVDVAIKESDALQHVTVEMDLTDAELDIPRFGLLKPEGQPAQLVTEVHRHANGDIKAPSFLLGSDDIEIQGAVEYQAAEKELKVFIPRCIYGRNDLSLNLTAIDSNKIDLSFEGKSADLGPMLSYFYNAESKEKSPKYILVDGQLEQLFLMNNVSLNDVTTHASIKEDEVYTAALLGHMNPGERIYLDLINDVSSEEGKRKYFNFFADNAGNMLRGLNIADTIYEGKLKIKGGTVSLNDNRMAGEFVLNDFRMVGAPILTRLLTLGSLSAMSDMLKGEGINFSEMTGGFNFLPHALELKKVRAAGNGIAITLSGRSDIKANKLDFSGSIIPGTLLNTLPGKIPLIGKILGGKDNEGVFALRYTVTGPMNKPEVNVNPLSTFTPGIFRSIWGD